MRIMIIGLVLVLATILFLHFENNALSLTKIKVTSAKLPFRFDGLKIVHLSDLHSKLFGRNQLRLIKTIRNLRPDLIFFTGDLIDATHGDPDNGFTLMRQAAKIAPVYFVNGNHEWFSRQVFAIDTTLTESGIQVLNNNLVTLSRGHERIQIAGIDDFPGNKYHSRRMEASQIDQNIRKTGYRGLRNEFTILMAHHPEFGSIYRRYRFDLVFCGHAHGGQIRLPFIGGLFAPGQGIFPQYTAKIYRIGSTQMVVSRGLGNSVPVPRVFNRPEIILVTLHRK